MKRATTPPPKHDKAVESRSLYLTMRDGVQIAIDVMLPAQFPPANAAPQTWYFQPTPLTADLEISGYPIVTLHVASSEADGAFFVYLEDVEENGVVRYITEGQWRAIHRKLSATPAPYQTGMPHHSFKRADSAPMPRGETVTVTIGLQPTSVLIRKGHAVRVAIGGADKDTFARIPSQGTPVWEVSHGGRWRHTFSYRLWERIRERVQRLTGYR